ncbi:MAG TPA: P-II family nitrogen regulator, partial [Campylobacteraceae bacterium]|nr:P-II family nitrogen regulator [Campylobacteraceae bacterium]
MFLKELKRVEIILEGEHIDSLKRILEKIEIGGYTIFHNLEGKGAKGYHEGRLLFNEEDALVMLMTVVEEEKMEAIVKGLQPFFEKHSGRIFV